MDHDTANLILIAGVIAAVVALAARVIAREQRQTVKFTRELRNCCGKCGYDLRASSGSCPECGTTIPVRVRDLIAAGRHLVKKDVECIGCGVNLRGRYVRGSCAVCGTKVMLAVRAAVAGELGVQEQQIDFILAAFRSARQGSSETNRRRTFHECCIVIRDHAVHLKENVSDAKIYLSELGIGGSEQIGRGVFTLVDFGVFEGDERVDRRHFDGIFTLDELMNAAAPPESRDAAVGQIAANLGISVEQVNFISAAVSKASRRRVDSQSLPRHMSTRDACIAVREHAIDSAGSIDAARTLLATLGISGSDQIGEVIWALVRTGLLGASDRDHPEQFVGLFTLDELMNATES